jgi:hypothetical protein
MFHPGNRAVPLASVYMGKFSFASVYIGEIFTPVVHINAQEFLNSTTHRDLTNRAVLPSGPARLQYKHPLSQTENRWLKQNLTPNLISRCMHATPILIIIYKHYHRRNVKNEFSLNGCFLLVESLI